VLASHNSPGGPALAGDPASVEVATDLARQLNSQNGQLEEIGSPTPDASMADAPMLDTPMCCAPACCGCCPYWTFGAGAIFLNQSKPGHSPVVTAPVFVEPRLRPGTTLLNAHQFDPGIRFGYQLDAIRHNVGGSCWDLEARYFGINRWNSTEPTITAPTTGVAIPFVPGVIRIATAGSQVATVYESLLQNVELNARRSVNSWLQLIVGLRYIAFDDSIGITVTPVAGASRFNTINARNNLIGPQLGANALLWQGNRVGLQAFGKGGLYGNAASNNVSVTPATGTVVSSSANGGHTSFVGEIGLTGTYRLTNKWGLRSTYEMLWLDGVARAPDQIASSNPFAGTGSVTSNGALFFCGAFFGLEYNH
jgi:hypothetical protein